MNKFAYPRSYNKVNRNESTTFDANDLADQFAKNLQKNSVQLSSRSSSIYDEMYSIINGKKPKYPSVEAAVEDMLERSGITAYKKQLRAQNSQKTKIASTQVELFEKNPSIKQTIDNYIGSTKGNLSVPEIMTYVKGVHNNDVADNGVWQSPSLLTYVNERNIEEKKSHPDVVSDDSNLGKLQFTDDDIDPSNLDALHILNPSVVGK